MKATDTVFLARRMGESFMLSMFCLCLTFKCIDCEIRRAEGEWHVPRVLRPMNILSRARPEERITVVPGSPVKNACVWNRNAIIHIVMSKYFPCLVYGSDERGRIFCSNQQIATEIQRISGTFSHSIATHSSTMCFSTKVVPESGVRRTSSASPCIFCRFTAIALPWL